MFYMLRHDEAVMKICPFQREKVATMKVSNNNSSSATSDIKLFCYGTLCMAWAGDSEKGCCGRLVSKSMQFATSFAYLKGV